MKKTKRNRGIVELKNIYGNLFTLPWTIGILLFFAIPLVQSIWYSFSQVTIDPSGVKTIFIGLENYREILISDPDYTVNLKETMINSLYSLPIILLLSMVLAMLLNQKFRGRLFFRALYFLPVIIATSEVITYIFSTSSNDLSSIGISSSYSAGMIEVEDITEWLNISGEIGDYITETISKIFDLIWSCGIQIVLFLSGLQSVPSTLYEASKVEGATKWEEFWFITFPCLSNVTLLVAVFTIVELIANSRGGLVSSIYNMMSSGVYDTTSAMLWFYFLVAGGTMGIVIFLYNRFCMKRWE